VSPVSGESARRVFFRPRIEEFAVRQPVVALHRTGEPVLITNGLAEKLRGQIRLDAPNVRVLTLKREPKSLLDLPQSELDELRAPLLRQLKVSFRAPNKVGLYLFRDGNWVVENFNDQPVEVELSGERLTVDGRGWTWRWQ